MKKLSSYVISAFLTLTTIPIALIGTIYIAHDLYLEHQNQTLRYEQVIAQQVLDSKAALSQFDLLRAELVVTQISELDFIVSVKLESNEYGMTLAEVINTPNDDDQINTLNYSIKNEQGEIIGVLTVIKDKMAFLRAMIKSIAPKIIVLALILITVSRAFTLTILAALNRPFQDLQKFAFQIANGDYQTPSKTDSQFLEITTIFRSLEAMRLRLKYTISQLKDREEKHSRTYNLTQVCLFVIDVDKKWIIRANSTFMKVFEPIPIESQQQVLHEFIQQLMSNSSNGSFKYSLIIGADIRYFQINRSEIIGGEIECSALDITELMQAKLATESMLMTDSLTQVANRHCFNTDIEKLQNQSSIELTLMVLDLNGFKAINDSFGHSAGDHLLIEVARRLSNVLTTQPATLYRLGGDEFVILLKQEYKHKHVEMLIEKILLSFECPVQYQNHQLFVSASIGVDHYNNSQLGIMRTLHHADVAMYQAKTTQCKIAYSNALLSLQQEQSLANA